MQETDLFRLNKLFLLFRVPLRYNYSDESHTLCAQKSNFPYENIMLFNPEGTQSCLVSTSEHRWNAIRNKTNETLLISEKQTLIFEERFLNPFFNDIMIALPVVDN